MKIAIRDDDTSYFTKPQDLINAYAFLGDFPVSLSVVPYTVSMHKEGHPYGNKMDGGMIEYSIANNVELIKFLREQVKLKKYEIMLHGYSHQYNKVNKKWKAEMIWKDEERLYSELKKGKELLEHLFECSVKTFVAPNNHINKKAIVAIEKMKLNYSGIILWADRSFSIKYLKNFVIRWGYRITKKIAYGGVLDYGKHKEHHAYGISSYDRLIKEYSICKEQGHDFIIYTHYWDVVKNQEIRKIIYDFVEYAKSDDAEPAFVSECFEIKRQNKKR